MWRLPSGPARGDQSADEAGRLLADTLTWINAHACYFRADRPLWVARAPGRLDVMGGFGDYSGSRVLEFPLMNATWIVAQELEEPLLVVQSARAAETTDDGVVTIPLAELTPPDGPLAFSQAAALLMENPARAWAAYVAGALVVLQHVSRAPLQQRGFKVLVHSDVPPGKGISSSAALEVAALELFARLHGALLDERQTALLAQQVENMIVGAPCGVMDQMTALSGKCDHLMELLCQPAELVDNVPLPAELQLWGVDSGIRHAVSGADYGSVRTAAFMGYRILAEAAGLKATLDGAGRAHVDDPLFGGYLANVTPPLWHARFRSHIPEHWDGQAFLDRYGGITDDVTYVDPGRTYAVRACTEHPILENERVRRFRDIVAGGASSETARQELGGLMAAAHASYSACAIGADGTDHIVALARAAGAAAGLYGAKISGGGSGGTVVVLARRGSDAVIHGIARAYAADTGKQASVFSGSSSGARSFGVHHLLPI